MEKYKKAYKINKFKISAPAQNDKCELPDGLHSVSDIQDYFECIIKKHEIENRFTFQVKTGYCLELLTSETMKLLESTKNKITKDKNGENVPHLEIPAVVLTHCNIVNNDCQHDSGVLYTFVRNKSFG